MGEAEASDLKEANLERIKRMIPHRYPFLLIDHVKEIAVGDCAVGIKNVTVNEPHFQGHFPDKPVMPGVLIVEAMAQTTATTTLRLSSINKADRSSLRTPAVLRAPSEQYTTTSRPC